MNPADKVRRTDLTQILNSPDSSPEEQARANKQLKSLSEKPDPASEAHPKLDTFVYSADWDDVVESYMGIAKGEFEMRHPVAETVYFDLVDALVLGGSYDLQESSRSINRLCQVFNACKSKWMRHHVARALMTYINLHKTALGPELLAHGEQVYDADPDLARQPVPRGDWLGLIHGNTGRYIGCERT